MINTIISFFHKYKIKKILRHLKNKLKYCYRDLGEKALLECEDLVVQVDSTIISVNEEYMILEKEYFTKEEFQKDKEGELRFYKTDFEERFFELNNKLKFSKKRLIEIKKEVANNKKKLELRLRKEKAMVAKYKILTIFKNKDMNKTISNLKKVVSGITQKKEDFKCQIADYIDKLKKLNSEKIINFQIVLDLLKPIKKEMETLKAKICECEEEREFLLINLGKKLFQKSDLPHSLDAQKDEINKLKEEIKKREFEIR